METRERALRRLALGDAQVAPEQVMDGTLSDQRTRALVQLGALLALDGPSITITRATADAMATGIGEDEIVSALASLVPIMGISRVAAVAPKVGMALGYDVEAALEVR